MQDPFDNEDVSEDEIEGRFKQTLDRCSDEIDILVKAIDNIGDVMNEIRDRMTCIEYKALRKTVLALVAEKLEFLVNEID